MRLPNFRARCTTSIAVGMLLAISGCDLQAIVNAVAQADTVPPDVPVRHETITFVRPSFGFSSGLAWLNIIHDTRRAGQSLVELDYLRFYCCQDGRAVLVAAHEYDGWHADGGLYIRTPWFDRDIHDRLPVEFWNGTVVLRPSEHPDRVWHVWNGSYPRTTIPPRADRCWATVRARVTGPALLQLGIDYWRDATAPWAGNGVNNVEAAVSRWYFQGAGWQEISPVQP